MARVTQDYGSNNGAKAGSTAVPGTYGNGGSSYTIPGGAPSYLRTNYDMSGYKNVSDWSKASGIAPSNVKVTDTRNFSYTPSNNTPSYSGGGGGYGYSAPVYEQPDYSEWFNALTAINNQKYDALRKAFAEQKQRADEMNNMNFARNLREWRKMYADRRNGQGLTNRLGISYARDNNSREINNTFNENNLNAIAGRYTDLASLTSQLPNMNSDTIKKIMSTVGSWNI